MGASDARIQAAVGATLDAGTAHFQMLLESEPAGVTRSRSQGVCDFTHRREASHTVTEVPQDVPDVVQITDGGVVYSQDHGPGETGDQWFVLDMGSWASASLLSMLGWLYGAVDAQAGDSGEHTVTMSARRAVEACPEPLREDLRAAFALVGQLDAVATGRVRTDAANRVTECRLELPGGGEDGLFGSVDVRARVTLILSDFGEPVSIRPPGSGPPVPIGDCIEVEEEFPMPEGFEGMDRFTDRAQRVVALAQDEARTLDPDHVGPEHVLLALLSEGNGVAPQALESLGITLEGVREQVERIVGRGLRAPSGDVPLGPRAREVLERSLDEARRIGQSYVGTEHILLSLVREGEGETVATQALVGLGVDPDRVRREVRLLLSTFRS